MTAVNKQLSFLGEIDSHCFLGTTELDFGMGFGEFNIYVMLAGIMKSCYNFNAERKKRA